MDRIEAAGPFLVVDFQRFAIADEADAHVAFEVGDDFRALVRGGRGMVDPEHGFLADSHVVALHQPAVAPQQPHFVRALLPPIGRHGRDDDGIDVIALRHVDFGEERSRQKENKARIVAGTLRVPSAQVAGTLRVPSAHCDVARFSARKVRSP